VTGRGPGRALGAGLGCVLLVLAAAIGCGKRGAPVAPERRLPATASGLTAAVESRAVTLTWTNPERRADGSPLRDLETIRVFRRAEQPEAPLKPAMLTRGRVAGYEQIAAIRPRAPAPAVVERGTVRFTDRTDLNYGQRYVYVVTAVDSQGRSSAPSARAAVVFLAAPEPPRNVRAEPGDRQVRLEWRAPETYIDGQPVVAPLHYVVLRGVGEAPLAPITAEPIDATTYTDTGVANDVDYRYAVVAIRVEPAGQARGEPAPPVAASPARATAPGAPTGLVAIPALRSVRLAWNEVADPEVALYAVYRAEGPGAFARIGTTPAGSTVFVDGDVQPGRRYRYAVTAIDRARRPNESPRSDEVAVTLD
jgi:fibronectin type 3 domain-containing protein